MDNYISIIYNFFLSPNAKIPSFLSNYLIEIITAFVILFICFALNIMFPFNNRNANNRNLNNNHNNNNNKRPKWEGFSMTNYIILAIFGASIVNAIINPAQFNMALLITWSLCLTYFLGFFGVAFIDKEEIYNNTHNNNNNNNNIIEEKKDDNNIYDDNDEKEELPEPVLEAEFPSPGIPPRNYPLPKYLKEYKLKDNETIKDLNFMELTNDEILSLIEYNKMKDHQLEKLLGKGNYTRAVEIRRLLFERRIYGGFAHYTWEENEDEIKKIKNISPRQNFSFDAIPFHNFPWEQVHGANCEIVVGYVPIPLGIVGPLRLDGEMIYIPMATTEGTLVASTNRGCKALTQSGGAESIILKDGITRAPCLRFPTVTKAANCKSWLEIEENKNIIKEAFNSTTRFGKLEELTSTLAGRNLYIRFVCFSGDAMGMNMISKGCDKSLCVIQEYFPTMELIAISGNLCTDKKPSAINWIEGRGKSILVEATLTKEVVEKTLKTTIEAMARTNREKSLVGSAMAGSIGGFNAHAANIVTAVFIATGQDPAQNVESSNCITLMEPSDDFQTLHVSVTMPSVEVGTTGGGTSLPPMAANLDILGVKGPSQAPLPPGSHSKRLARVVGAAVLAGELSLIGALASNQLVKSHMIHNRAGGK